MIDVKFAVETKDGNWFENINSIEECFSHDVKKIYETTFGTKQLLIYDNGNSQYNFNFMSGYFTIEALHQLQIYDAKHKILSGRHDEILSEEIAIMLGKECSMEIGVSPKVNVRTRTLRNRRKIDKTTFKDILNDYHYKELNNVFLEVLCADGLYMKSIFLYGDGYKWLDYLQSIDYKEY